MTRRAFIGLSSPLAYDYKNPSRRVHVSDSSAPNPILEDAMGLLIFYDEIIFLSRHFCPKNMRELGYVSFLTDRPDFIEKIDTIDFSNSTEKDQPFGQNDYRSMVDIYVDAISKVTGQPQRTNTDTARFRPDNHTHQIHLNSKISSYGSPTSFRAMCLDWEVLSTFGLDDCDPIYNSTNAGYYNRIVRSDKRGSEQVAIAQELIVRHLPNYLGRSGPYHECLEELRGHRFVAELRSYLDELVEKGKSNEVGDVAREMERLAEEYRGRVFAEHLSDRNEYFTMGQAAITDAVGLFVPGAGLATSLVSSYFQRHKRKKMRWAGFVTDVQSSHLAPKFGSL